MPIIGGVHVQNVYDHSAKFEQYRQSDLILFELQITQIARKTKFLSNANTFVVENRLMKG